jgi:hypothetical protein
VKKIQISLNSKSINAAIKQLKAYELALNNATQKVTQELTQTGVEIAKQNAAYMDIYDSGELVNGIVGEYTGGFRVAYGKGYVHSTAPHSAFCEFGTGVVGEANQHPNITIPGWRYDVNEHGESGWWYTGKDGESHWTMGMPSRPYMYETAQKLRQVAETVSEQIVRSALK